MENVRLLIREANLIEIDEIKDFYRKNPDEHIMLRDDISVTRAIENGVFFLALDISRAEGDRIIGASAVYSIDIKDDDGKTTVLKEAGGSLVKKEYRGFGIHKIFHYARSLHEYILDRGGFDAYFGAIICPNDPSEANVKKCGFQEWADVPQKVAIERAVYAKEGQSIKFFKFKIDSLIWHAKELLIAEETGCAGDSIKQLMLSLQTIRLYRPILQKIASGKIKEALELE